MFDIVEHLAHEILGADDPGIGEVAAATQESLCPTNSVFAPALVLHYSLFDDRPLARVNSTGEVAFIILSLSSSLSKFSYNNEYMIS